MVAMSQAGNGNARPVASRVRIGLVAGATSLRDLGPVVRHLIVALLEEPMPVTLICPAHSAAESLPETLVQTIRYGPMRLPFFRGRLLDVLAEQVAEARLSLLHALDEGAVALTRYLAARADAGYVAGVTSLRHERRVFDEHCRALLAASEPIFRRLRESAHAPRAEAVYLVRPGVHQVRRATCFLDPSHSTAIVAAGRLDSFQPFAAVIKAFAELHQAKRECVFFLIGNGRAEGALRKLAGRLGLMSEMTFVDYTAPEQLTGILKAADIFISPRPSERVDIELLSAMAGGVPVLAAAGGAADFVISDQTALTFASGSADELTVKLKALLDDRAAARALAENALAHLRENHSPAKMGKQLVEIYQAVLAPMAAEA